jgi:2-dehydropantoate 2-reductase
MMACQTMDSGQDPTIAILGAGAMGALFGARLAEGGADPLLVDVDATVVEQITAQGVRIRRDGEVRSVPVRATLDPSDESAVDLLLVFVKSYATEDALALAGPLVGENTNTLSLQNGWGNIDRIAALVPRERVFAGVTYHSATLLGPGMVDHTAVGRTYLGPAAGGSLETAESLGSAFERAGLEAEVTDSVVSLIWSKLVLNASANPVAALTGLRAGALAEVPEVFALIEGVAREVIAVGQANGHSIDTDAALANVRDVLVKAGPATSSMRQDVEAGRRTEFEVMTGAVLRGAAEAGVDAPLNEVINALLTGYEEARARA